MTATDAAGANDEERRTAFLGELFPGLTAIGGRLAGPEEPSRVHFPMPDGSQVEVDLSFVTDFVGGQRYSNLQIHAFVYDDIVPAAMPDLLWAVTQINRYLPLGAFGVLHDLQMLYWKQNSLLDLSLSSADNVDRVQAEVRLALRSVGDFWTTVRDVASGAASGRDALAANKWGSVLFGL